MSAAAQMEATLALLAERKVELRHGLYKRFFAAFPARREAFLCPEATSLRMTDETLQMLYGLASGEAWVWPLVAELIYTHRAYGALPLREYDAFVDMVVEELEAALGGDFTRDQEAAWSEQAERLKTMIGKAQAEWDQVLPRA
ncbi:MAG: globin [Novosphingobium sp.]